LRDHNYNNLLSSTTLRNRIKAVKNFFEFNEVDISDNKFKLKIRLPKAIRRNKEALTKDDVRDIILAWSDIRLKTYVMFLACTGMRAVEALSIRLKDINLGEFTKTRQDRHVYLTSEMNQQLKIWLDYGYRYHRSCYVDKTNGNYKSEYITPVRKSDDLVFAIYGKPHNADLRIMYIHLAISYAKMLDRIGRGDREDNDKRRKITFHSFRRFVKSIISDLGFGDYSEWFIGHSGSTYYRKSEKEKAEIFAKIEPYLTFLDYSELEANRISISLSDYLSYFPILSMNHHSSLRLDILVNI
jgi:integrase